MGRAAKRRISEESEEPFCLQQGSAGSMTMQVRHRKLSGPIRGVLVAVVLACCVFCLYSAFRPSWLDMRLVDAITYKDLLHPGLIQDNPDQIKELLEKGANVNARVG